LGINAELIEGDRGEFNVLLNEKIVAKKGWLMFPSGKKTVEAIKQMI
jgi:hypothetical protein